MKRIDMPVARRTEVGKGPNRRLRASGRVPAVIYGAGSEPDKVSLDNHTFSLFLASAAAENALLNIKNSDGSVESDETVAVVREVQRDPLSRRLMHVDLYRIRMDAENDFDIPVHGHGIPIGVRQGGILETHVYNVRVRCLPENIPGAFNIDLLNIGINHALHARDLVLPEGVVLVSDPATTIFTVLPPKKEAEPVAAAVEGAEPAQPEVIGKKKEEPAES